MGLDSGEKVFRVSHRGEVLAVRHAARKEAEGLGFSAAGIAEIETAVAELATNLVKHAEGGGEVILRRLGNGGAAGLELVAKDQGPGIADLDKAMADGYSTAGSLGIGLPGVKRLMDEFSIQTGAGAGTEITARKWLERQTGSLLAFSVLATPFPGEQLSGDGYFIKRLPGHELFAVIDGLGHGAKAHAVTQRCLETLESCCREEPAEIVARCHEALRHSRGAAMALARVERGSLMLQHISVGNVDTRVYNTPQPVRPYCFNGTLGMALEGSSRVVEYPLARGAIIVMCSDGIVSRFEVPASIFVEPPQRIAESIFSKHVRGTDDAILLVAKVV